jgi:hypothetical protein
MVEINSGNSALVLVQKISIKRGQRKDVLYTL